MGLGSHWLMCNPVWIRLEAHRSRPYLPISWQPQLQHTQQADFCRTRSIICTGIMMLRGCLTGEFQHYNVNSVLKKLLFQHG